MELLGGRNEPGCDSTVLQSSMGEAVWPRECKTQEGVVGGYLAVLNEGVAQMLSEVASLPLDDDQGVVHVDKSALHEAIMIHALERRAQE